jgi:D-3-phosphoglycerate dehydrogenase
VRVLLLETIHEEAQALLDAAAETTSATALDPSTVTRQAAGCRAIITRGRGRIPAEVMEANPDLYCVARCGVGLDNIDVAAASRLGIAVVHAPDSSTQSVAEHALALVFALSRQFGRLDRAVKADHWGVREGFRGLELSGRTLGIVGMGRIGRRVAELGHALGMKVVTWSPHSRDERFAALPLDALLRCSDVVSLHLALTQETEGLIGRAALEQLKPGAILVNTARGALIDEEALAEALAEGRLGGAGLDVLIAEPPAADHPLLRLDNVVITPHTAGITETAYRRMCVETCEQVLRILREEEPDPRQVYNYGAWRAVKCESPVRERQERLP